MKFWGIMRFVIIGCGVMGSNFARGLSSLSDIKLALFDHHASKAKKLAEELNCTVLNNLSDIANFDAILLAIKPKDLADLVKEALQNTSKNTLIFSILAGRTIKSIEALLPSRLIIRLMPNVAISIGKGLIGIAASKSVKKADLAKIEPLFSWAGGLVWIEEEKFDAFTALAASGPAYLLVVLEAFIEAGVLLGLTADEAKEISSKMIEGTAALIQEKKASPSEMILKICSPGGTTIEGLKEMEKYKVRAAIFAAIEAAYKKAKAL